jgi:hypothetical protein
VQNFHQSTWDYEIVYADRFSDDEQLLVTEFLWKTKNMNLGGGEAKFYVLFYGDNS